LADVSSLRFRHELKNIEDIEPWGREPHLSLSWYGLSDGQYCIETDSGRLLEYLDAETGATFWCDYQVARLFEDLSEIAPTILLPVPKDVAQRFLAWSTLPANKEPPDDDLLAESWFSAQEWWGWRQLDFGYLSAGPRLYFWRTDDDVHLQWRAHKWEPSYPLTVARADQTMPVETFTNAAQSFLQDFVQSMRRRIEAVERDGWRGKPCDIDIPALITEQRFREREPLIDARIAREADWDTVRRDLNLLGA
jgi:hypothetical protein